LDLDANSVVSGIMLIRQLDLNSPLIPENTREQLCWQFYNSIYREAFPVADEAEDPTIWLPLMSGKAPSPKPLLHVVLAATGTDAPKKVEAASLLGGIVFEYFRKSRAALITYLCVRQDVRGRGVARFLLGQAVDCVRAPNGPVPLFAEAEDPRLQSDQSHRKSAIARLRILDKLGFREIPIHYRQPSLGPGKRPVDSLKFLLLVAAETAGVKVSALQAFMREFYDSLGAELDEARTFDGLNTEDVPTIALGKTDG
jgi:GNAT superfamily N-acetyltransferase